MTTAYDALVIGSGTAGQTAAYRLNAHGFRVGLIEHRRRPGGTCALRGCQSKKWFYEGAETVARARHLEGIGITTPAAADWRQLRDAKNGFTEKVPARTVDGLESAGIDYIRGRARFDGPRTLIVGDRSLTAAFIIVATGAVPTSLPIDGFERAIDSSAFLDLDALPPRILFIGGGFISFEFAHFAARLGPVDGRRTILEAQERPLSAFDAEMVDLLTDASGDAGIDLHCGIEITGIEKSGDAWVVTTRDHGRFEADLVVNGAGRTADVEDLDLQRADITAGRQGIAVDDHMQTDNPRVFAVGDCAATTQLARVADAEAQIAADTIAARLGRGQADAVMDYTVVPAVLFTCPQYGMVGKTEQALKHDGVVYRKSFAKQLSWPTYRRLGLRSAGYKILCDADGRLLGAHILSDSATGLIGMFTLAMNNRIPVDRLHRQSVMTPYPSRESDILYMLEPLLK